MNGAELLIQTARDLGAEVCFANPGTTEMPFVRAFDSVGGLRTILALHENVCSGAADGYGRLAGKPALVLTHLGPGFANSIANLHNARKAGTPIVNLIGEHASWHLSADAPLHSDIESLCRPVSTWVRRIRSADEAARDMAEAIAATQIGTGGIATLIMSYDFQEAKVSPQQISTRRPTLPQIDPAAIERAEGLLRRADNPALFLGGRALFGPGLESAGRIAVATGATMIGQTGFAQMACGQGVPTVKRLPYFPEEAAAALRDHDAVVVCGAEPPVSFFGYTGLPSRYLEGRDDTVVIAGKHEDASGALQALASALDADATWRPADRIDIPAASGTIDGEQIGRAVMRQAPENCIVVATAVTSGWGIAAHAAAARPHTQLALTGGAIGEGLALAAGAAVAAPDRKVIAVEADGSGAYILQALWTQARQELDITTVICANQRYRILQVELERAGVGNPGPHATSLMELGQPVLDWVSLAKGFGVAGESVDTGETLEAAIQRGLVHQGPYLIEAVMRG